MKTLKLVTDPSAKILRTVCREITKFDGSLKKLTQEMQDVMVESKGIGIAAPQVGLDLQICLVTLGADTKQGMVIPLINPVIVSQSEEQTIEEEGCLSIPEVFGKVARSKTIVVEFQDIKGKTKQLKLNDLDARVVLHEVDHLNGVLFIDKLVE